MPLTRVSMKRGKSPAYRKAILENLYLAMRETFNVPEGDRFMTISQHDDDDFAYGPDYQKGYRRVAHYIDRILRGTPPGDLPIEEAMRYELVVNLKTARALGVTIPQTVLFRADLVVE